MLWRMNVRRLGHLHFRWATSDIERSQSGLDSKPQPREIRPWERKQTNPRIEREYLKVERISKPQSNSYDNIRDNARSESADWCIKLDSLSIIFRGRVESQMMNIRRHLVFVNVWQHWGHNADNIASCFLLSIFSSCHIPRCQQQHRQQNPYTPS